MPQPETVHVKATLSNVALAYFQEPDVFIADRLSPMVRSAKQSDYYYLYGKEHFNVISAVRRPGSTPVEVEHTVSTDQYVCQEYALREMVTEEERDNADNPIEPEADAARYVSERLRLSREYRIAVQLTTAANYQSGLKATLTGDDQWQHGTSSDPVANIQTALDAVAAQGKRPNTMWMGYPVWAKLKHHPDLIARLKDSSTRVITSDLLKQIWEEIEEVLIGGALYNSAAEGQDQTLGYVWGNYFGVAYINRALPNKKHPSFNYTFVWPYSARGGRVRREGQGGAAGGIIYQGRTYPHADPGARADWVEVGLRTGFKITGAYMGYLITDAVG